MSKSDLRARVRWGLCVFMAIASLLGCGGGGSSGGGNSPDSGSNGGSSIPVAQPSLGTVPLRLDASNFSAISAEGVRPVENTLYLALHAISEVSTLARNGTLQLDRKVSNDSRRTAHAVLTDADGNGVPSAGDTLTVEYVNFDPDYLISGCYGTVTIRLASVDNAQTGAISGTVDYGSKGLANGSTTLLGSFSFRRVVTELNERLEVNSTAADNLRRILGSAKGDQVDAYQRVQIARNLQFDTARASVTGSLSMASDRLGGRIEVSLEPQFSAYFNSQADIGGVRIDGAAKSSIRLPANSAGTRAFTAELDSNGDGVVDSTVGLRWQDLFNLSFWSERNLYFGSYYERNDQALLLLSVPEFNQVRGHRVADPIRLQFDRPLNPEAIPQFQLYDGGDESRKASLVSDANGALTFVPSDVEVRGALILIRPRQPLQYGRFYSIMASMANEPESSDVTFQSVGNLSVLHANKQFARFNTDDLLYATISGATNKSLVIPGRETPISATVPRATSLPLRYQWTQVSGPAVVLSTPTAANTMVRLADGSQSGVGRAVLQLTVTDAIGRNSKSEVELQTANLSGVTNILYYATAVDSYPDQNRTVAATDKMGVFKSETRLGQLSLNFQGTDSNYSWSARVADENGGIPAVGTYTGAKDLPEFGSKVPQLSMDFNYFSCKVFSGSFKMLEIEYDGSGPVKKLALDFELSCISSVSPSTRGSVRINSSVPVPL